MAALTPNTVRPSAALMFKVVEAIDSSEHGRLYRSDIFAYVFKRHESRKVKEAAVDDRARWRMLDLTLGYMTKRRILRYDNADTGTWSVRE